MLTQTPRSQPDVTSWVQSVSSCLPGLPPVSSVQTPTGEIRSVYFQKVWNEFTGFSSVTAWRSPLLSLLLTFGDHKEVKGDGWIYYSYAAHKRGTWYDPTSPVIFPHSKIMKFIESGALSGVQRFEISRKCKTFSRYLRSDLLQWKNKWNALNVSK